MSLDDLQRKLIEEALEKGRKATREDLLNKFLMEITLGPDYSGYCNPRVTATVDSTSHSEVTHLRFTPVPKAGFVTVEACTEGEEGAEPFIRGDSGRTGKISLRAALLEFNLTFPDDRKLKLPIETNVVTVEGQEQTTLMFQVKRPVRLKKELRPRKNGTTTAGTAPAQAGAPAATAATSAQAAAKQPEAGAPKPAAEGPAAAGTQESA